jgi:hypothetical protein
LLETLIATAICTTVMFGMASMVIMATQQNKNQGASMAQCTTLAAQKLDQLMELTWTSATTDTGLTAGGSVTADTTSYVDYLDPTGGISVTATAVNRFFTRRWQITDPSSTSKLITVMVYAKAVGQGAGASAPQATLACYKVQQ